MAGREIDRRNKKTLDYVRDKPNDWRPHSDGSLPFQAFVVSGQMRHPLLQAGGLIIALAKAEVGRSEDDRNGHYIDQFAISKASTTMFKPKRYPHAPRAMVEVTNDAVNAVALEFGSGGQSEGNSAGQDRPQGGYNIPKRPLGRAAAQIGDFHGD